MAGMIHKSGFKNLWPLLERGVHAASSPPNRITLKRAEARAPIAATALVKLLQADAKQKGAEP